MVGPQPGYTITEITASARRAERAVRSSNIAAAMIPMASVRPQARKRRTTSVWEADIGPPVRRTTGTYTDSQCLGLSGSRLEGRGQFQFSGADIRRIG